MADISKLTLLDGNTYDIKAIRSNAVPIVAVDSTSTSTAFTIQVPEFANETALRDGLFMWLYNGTVASASGFTFDVNGLGAKPVYNTQSERSSTLFVKNKWFSCWYSTTFVEGGCWIIGVLSDANTTYTTFNSINQGYSYLANSVIYRYQLLFQMDYDKVTPLNNNSNTTGKTKTMLTNVEFDPFGDIYYYYTTTTVSANTRVTGTNLQFMRADVDLRYTFNCGTDTLTERMPVYLKVTMLSNGKCKIASATPLVQTLPSTNDGYYYIYLGTTYSTYQIVLWRHHPIYYYDGTSVRQAFPPDSMLATSTMPGLMSAADKTALDTLASSSYWQYNSTTDSIDLIFPS